VWALRTSSTIRLTRMPSLATQRTAPPSPSRSGTEVWCRPTTSQLSLKTGDPEEPGSVSVAYQTVSSW
jgi:hypothetical protein